MSLSTQENQKTGARETSNNNNNLWSSRPNKIVLSKNEYNFICEGVDSFIKERLNYYSEGNVFNPTKDENSKELNDLLQQFIKSTFTIAKDSLIIDGVDGSELNLPDLLNETPEECEPFDLELNDNLRKVYQDLENLTVQVTTLRRTQPEEIAEIIKEKYNNSQDVINNVRLNDENYDTKSNQVIRELENKLKIPKQNEMDSFENLLENVKLLQILLPQVLSQFDKSSKAFRVFESI